MDHGELLMLMILSFLFGIALSIARLKKTLESHNANIQALLAEIRDKLGK